MASNLPDYVASAQPVPQSNRIPWFKSTAQTYAGIMLWFVFWDSVPVGSAIHGTFPGYSEMVGGTLSQGIGIALLALVAAAVLCHFFYYLVPGMMGMKTGLPLYIVGTSTYGATGGFLMPGFLMGLLQFGWLGVNAFFSAWLLVTPLESILGLSPEQGAMLLKVVAALWAIAAAFMGLMGIQYVARVATFLPLIPLTILIVLFAFAAPGLKTFNEKQIVETGARLEITLVDGEQLQTAEDFETEAEYAEYTNQIESSGAKIETLEPKKPLEKWGVFALIMTYVIGFFATAGAAGADFGMNNRDGRDVQLGGLVGITLATIFAGGMSLLIVAGAYGSGAVSNEEPFMAATPLMSAVIPAKFAQLGPVFMYLLAVAAFPPACFSAFIAANSFKTTLPKINPFITVGCGTAVSIALAVSGIAGDVIGVFSLVGASFGPICGAMAADYIVAGMKWAGPRRAFNPAGWISWIFGFVVGAAGFIPGILTALTKSAETTPEWVTKASEIAGWVPVPPLSAFIVGFLLYYLLAKIGLESQVLEMPAAAEEPAEEKPAEEKPAEEEKQD